MRPRTAPRGVRPGVRQLPAVERRRPAPPADSRRDDAGDATAESCPTYMAPATAITITMCMPEDARC